jgi:DNA-binding beta-propeller fold protein YncE
MAMQERGSVGGSKGWLAAALVAAMAFVTAMQGAARAAEPPRFEVDATWPKPLPNNWILGQVAGVAVDAKDHVWIIHRPRSLTPDEQGATLTPQRSKCCVPAPPVLEFDQAGNLLRSWGGPGPGYDWPQNEHGLYIDSKGAVWLGGNGERDGQVLKFTQDGKFILQIGKFGPQTNSNDTTRLGRPAGLTVDAQANELYVADGYFNRRVIVFDADTGAYKRHWGAYGGKPDDTPLPPYDPTAPVSKQFANPVHCVRIARDGLVYVCDRDNDRIQVFHKDGSFVREFMIERGTLVNGSVWDLEIWPDSAQSWLLNADGESNEVRILSRSTGAAVGAFGRGGRQAGNFHWIHNLALDSKGNVYTTEVDTGKRVQRFILKNPASLN